jgi:hypothetical protein
MAINFPNSPTNGQVYIDTASGNRYVYDAAKIRWVSNTYIQSIIGGFYSGNNGEVGQQAALGDIFRIHSNTLYQNVTVYSGNNAVCAGPLNLLGANTSLIIQPGARVVIV